MLDRDGLIARRHGLNFIASSVDYDIIAQTFAGPERQNEMWWPASRLSPADRRATRVWAAAWASGSCWSGSAWSGGGP